MWIEGFSRLGNVDLPKQREEIKYGFVELKDGRFVAREDTEGFNARGIEADSVDCIDRDE